MVSTKGRYALRVMLYLSEHNSGDFIPLSEISESQGISIKYLEIIVSTLVKAKILEGHRGKGGGYRLTRKPEEYTVGEILELSEISLMSVACLSPDADACPRETACKTLPMWKKYDALVHDFFSKITIADLASGNI